MLDQLPDKSRAVVTVPIDNRKEYDRAEQDFVRWLLEQIDEEGSDRLAPNRRAEALVRMTALRRLAAQGKLAAALAWISDFAESEERLVVFAHHRDIQAAVAERFPESAQIVGTDSLEEREANVQRFQADDGPTVCVASLEVASHGFTLTAAANVAFLELAWTPAKHDQAEDRDTPDRTGARGHGVVPAGGGDDRRADRDAARGEARSGGRDHRRRGRRRNVDRRCADRRLRRPSLTSTARSTETQHMSAKFDTQVARRRLELWPDPETRLAAARRLVGGVSLESVTRDSINDTRPTKDNGEPAHPRTRRSYVEYALKQEAEYAGLVEPVDQENAPAVRRAHAECGKAWAEYLTGLSPTGVAKALR